MSKKKKSFIEQPREDLHKRPVEERVQDNRRVYEDVSDEKVQRQATRCMDCGVPFCQAGCPLGNIIPDWNTFTSQDKWREAWERLRTTNNFPEFTGRICPAPCESACVLGLVESPVTIEQIEQGIIEHAYREGWVTPEPPTERTGKTVAIVGSGPAGLACAQQLNRAGHLVTVFERDDRIGGLLRYGIPEFKMEKWVVDRRLEILREEGIRFEANVEIGEDYAARHLQDEFDAVVLCTGATKPRDVDLPGRDLDGIHFAWEYLWQHGKRVAGENIDMEDVYVPEIDAHDKNVIVIGGGDTASDCIGTANRQGARSITNFELFPEPPEERPEHQPWPFYPNTLSTSSSHEEGVERVWAIDTIGFEGDEEGWVRAARTVDVMLSEPNGSGGPPITHLEGSERTWKTDLVIIAIGFTGPERGSLVDQLGVELDERGRMKTDANYMTSTPGVFAAGDNERGQSLVVWAISDGREAARGVDEHLMGYTELPSKGGGDLPRV